MFARIKVIVLRGSPAEYLLVKANAYRGPIHVVETTDEAVNILLSSTEISSLLTDAVIADYIATKVKWNTVDGLQKLCYCVFHIYIYSPVTRQSSHALPTSSSSFRASDLFVMYIKTL